MEDHEKLGKSTIEWMVEDMHRRLFGNGQPGILEKFDHRLRYLERIAWILVGAVTVIEVAHKFGFLK